MRPASRELTGRGLTDGLRCRRRGDDGQKAVIYWQAVCPGGELLRGVTPQDTGTFLIRPKRYAEAFGLTLYRPSVRFQIINLLLEL